MSKTIYSPMISRRFFTQVSGGALLSVSSSHVIASGVDFQSRAVGEADTDDSNILIVVVPGGWDPSYLFDARPLEMTTAGIIQNYWQEPIAEFSDRRGHRCWRSTVTDPLLPFFDQMAIVRGVIMADAFDGHEENLSLGLTGNAGGGVPVFAAQPDIGDALLGYVQTGTGTMQARFTNFASGNRLDGNILRKLVTNRVSRVTRTSDQFTRMHLEKLAHQQHGSRGLNLLASSFARRGQLINLLDKLANSLEQQEPSLGQLVAHSLLSGLTNNVVHVADTHLTDRNNLDCHDGASASEHPQRLRVTLETCASILRSLKETEGKQPGKSLLDETTVMILSEFGRTMRQVNIAIERSGTDHNTLNNQVFLVGKGIRGGQIFGGSDLQSIVEFERTSDQRNKIDPQRVRTIGMKCDFVTGMPLAVQDHTPGLDGRIRMQSVLKTFERAVGRPLLQQGRSNAPQPLLSAIVE
jgi:hypothetical protein